MKKTKVQIVGNYYVPALIGNFPNEIYVQNTCCSVSPLTLCGEPDKQVESEWENKIRDLNQWAETPSSSVYSRQTQELFDIKKNFCDFLSRDKEVFCDNTVFSPVGKEVIYKNEADYIIIDNSAAFRGLVQFNGVLYTRKWPVTPFSTFLSKQSSANTVSPWETDGSFNWKYYFDKYIDTILSQYESFQIILIRSPYSKYFYENDKINKFEKLNPKQKIFINKLDDYFIERTGCFVINSLCNIVPMKFLNPHGYPYGNGFGKWRDDIVSQIMQIIKGKKSSTYDERTFVSPIARALYKKIRKDKQEEISDLILKAENQRAVTIRKIITDKSSKLLKIDSFIEKSFLTLSDYIENITDKGNEPDLSLIEIYTEYLNVDLNDILTIYLLYSSDKYTDKSVFDTIIANLFSSVTSEPIKKSDELLNDNIQYLSDYPYIDTTCLSDIKFNKKYIQICDDVWLVIDVTSTHHSIYIIQNIFENNLNCEEIINNGYICDIQHADALTFSYDYYVEKAKRGDGAIPTYLMFKQKENFLESLCYIDYTELLKNEKFVFVIGNNEIIRPDNYIPIVDLTELLNPDLSVVLIASGLGDQISRYVLGKLIEKYTSKPVIYDDIATSAFNGFEVNKLAKDKMNLLSSKLSDRLSQKNLFEKLFSKISSNYTYMTQNADWVPKQTGRPYYVAGNNIRNLLELNIPYRYFNVLYGMEKFKLFYDFDLSEFIEFPPFQSEEQKKLADNISSCDSIVLHIRRGDYVNWGWETSSEYYVEAIEKIMKLRNYTNKKFFVFSDDINWCRKNKKDLGLENVDNCEVIFVDLNKTDESFRDMQLMSLGKVIISGESHFARIAALYSKSCEIYCNSNSNTNELYQTHIRKNKYDIGKFSKNYRAERSSKQPKDYNKNK